MTGYCRTYFLLFLIFLTGCARLDPMGGGQINYDPAERQVDPSDVLVPEGFKVEVVARGLTFPTAVVENDEGQLFVTESGYAYGEVILPPKLYRVNTSGSTELIVEGTKNGPWTGITYHDGYFYMLQKAAKWKEGKF